MRLAKFLCLASMMMLAIVLVGPGSASATALCEDEPVKGECVVTYKSGTAFTGKGSGVEIQNSLSNIVCKESTIQGKTSGEPTGKGEALKNSITALTFSGCEIKGSACTVTAENLPYNASLSSAEKNNGSLKVEKGEKGAPKGKAVCGGFLNCTFSGEPTLQFLGGNPAKIVANKAALTVEGGFLCPKSAFLNASYTLSQPSGGKAFVAEFARRQTVFCDEILFELCPIASQYEQNFAYELDLAEPSTFEYVYNGGNVTLVCPESTLAVANFAIGVPLRASTFGGTPTFPAASCNMCNVTAMQMPYEMRVEAEPLGMVDGDGEVKLLSLTEGPPEFDIHCGGIHCFYEAKEAGIAKDEVIGSFYGGEPAAIEFFDTLEKVAGSDALCGPTMVWFALYEITNPPGLPVFATRR